MEIQYGGKLEFGDFIVVSEGNRLSFGFYAGEGKSGTLQYYYFSQPGGQYHHYKQWVTLSDAEKALPMHNNNNKMYAKGFTSKCLWKSYINALHKTRVAKVDNPEAMFTDPGDSQDYRESVEALKAIGMIK